MPAPTATFFADSTAFCAWLEKHYASAAELARLSPPLEKTFRAQRSAWAFFNAQPPGDRRLTAFWVVSAKQLATGQRRLQQLIAASARSPRL